MKTTVNKVYKIRRKSDGLFSTGGYWPSFTKKGKTWSGIGALKNHLRSQFDFYYGTVSPHPIYVDKEGNFLVDVVVSEVVTTESLFSEGEEILKSYREQVTKEVEAREERRYRRGKT